MLQSLNAFDEEMMECKLQFQYFFLCCDNWKILWKTILDVKKRILIHTTIHTNSAAKKEKEIAREQ